MVFTFMMIDRDSVIKLSMMRYMTAVFLMDFEKIRFKNIFYKISEYLVFR